MEPLHLNIGTPALISSATKPLSTAERRALNIYETEIRDDLGAFIRVGKALLEIKRRMLYREKFATFEAYCHGVWGWKRSQAYRMLDAAEICANILSVSNVPAPEHERQLRPLSGLSPEKAAAAWTRASEKAGAQNITGALVRRTVTEMYPKEGHQGAPELDWQIRVKSLLKKAEALVERGDKDQVERILLHISLLLGVGETLLPNGGIQPLDLRPLQHQL